MRTEEEIRKYLDFMYSELREAQAGRIQTENYIATIKYYTGAINALKYVLKENWNIKRCLTIPKSMTNTWF